MSLPTPAPLKNENEREREIAMAKERARQTEGPAEGLLIPILWVCGKKQRASFVADWMPELS